jgi:hypothetical protein
VIEVRTYHRNPAINFQNGAVIGEEGQDFFLKSQRKEKLHI